ncbi:hypothetical protein [Ignavibacterium sp.]|uniref:hypothetical protein n=1 Tax=Ignavibacterium sp. TaxID=2651167 RepID=UPI00307DDA4A
MADNVISLKLVFDGKEALASINITDKELKELAQTIRAAGNESRNTGESIVHSFAQARNLIQGIKETFFVFAQTFTSHLTAYQEQEAALVKLNTALKQTGQHTEENVKALTDYAAELQRSTIYADEVTETVMAQLLAMGLSVEQTKQATLQAANLATVMGTDLNSAARAMADLFNGNAGMIGRYVKGLDEAVIKSGDLNKIIAMLNDRIGGQAEAMGQTAAGQIAKMNNAIDDLKENTGELLSNALGPIVKMLADITEKLNTLSPGLSGTIGIIGSMTTAFVTLRITGIIPAITSLELFGRTITGLRLALIKSGIGALIVALGYGLAELAKAYDKWQQAEANSKESYQKTLEQIKNDAIALKKEQLNKLITESEAEKIRLESEINKLKTDIKKAKKEIITTDKEGFEYRTYYETEESKRLAGQLKQQEQLLQLERDKIEIYKDLAISKKETKELTEEELKEEFEKNQTILNERFRHNSAIVKLETDNNLLLLEKKKEHLLELLNLYKKYGEDTSSILNQLTETELEIKIKAKPPEITIDDKLPFEPEELADVQYGNMLDYARLSKQEEINLWYNTELEKVKMYENSAEMIAALEEEKNRRLADLEVEKTNQTLEAYNQIFLNLASLFGKHTVAYKAMAIAQTIIETYKAATAALSPPPVGAGPLLGPILAATTLAAGFANVAKIGATKIEGFAEGGRLPRGKAGFVEGWHDEIIAPEKTFVEIFRSELKPQIFNSIQTFNLDKLSNTLNDLNNKLDRGIYAVAYLDEIEATKIYNTGKYNERKFVL